MAVFKKSFVFKLRIVDYTIIPNFSSIGALLRYIVWDKVFLVKYLVFAPLTAESAPSWSSFSYKCFPFSTVPPVLPSTWTVLEFPRLSRPARWFGFLVVSPSIHSKRNVFNHNFDKCSDPLADAVPAPLASQIVLGHSIWTEFTLWTRWDKGERYHET